ncbi:MAG: hypothetical protein IJ729_00850, partial [Alloprevotella sp.]|nr:hypothetical protein [Alloprevotella sp.]
RRSDERQGGLWLAEARSAMGQGDWGTARVRVDSIRLRTPLALDAREDAILLLDSVELLSAQAELTHTDSLIQAGVRSDSLTRAFETQMGRVKFYHRKLNYDRGNRKTH